MFCLLVCQNITLLGSIHAVNVFRLVNPNTVSTLMIRDSSSEVL
jgi:hypothetical protein